MNAIVGLTHISAMRVGMNKGHEPICDAAEWNELVDSESVDRAFREDARMSLCVGCAEGLTRFWREMRDRAILWEGADSDNVHWLWGRLLAARLTLDGALSRRDKRLCPTGQAALIAA